ncbi:MAG: hypothetical protein ACRDUB_20700 [Mycobacterium sp.]
MTDNEINESDVFAYPPEWLSEASNAHALAPWHPTATQRVRIAELAHQLANRDYRFAEGFVPFLREMHRERALPGVIVALLEQLVGGLISEAGRVAAVARLAADLATAEAEVGAE